jgi:hypothetical protein
MKKIISGAFLFISLLVTPAYAGLLGDILKNIPVVETPAAPAPLSNEKVVSGLKEALKIGATRAIENVAKPDGYLMNEYIKIMMPPEIRKVGHMLSMAGYDAEVNAFVKSMNRAAEKAAPKAATIIATAVTEMAFKDAVKVLEGKDTAATDYLRRKTSARIVEAFKPIVSASMDEVGVTLAYKRMLDIYARLPFTGLINYDLDGYVAEEAVDGLFFMIAKEEKKIRIDPTARATSLLKEVFGALAERRGGAGTGY